MHNGLRSDFDLCFVFTIGNVKVGWWMIVHVHQDFDTIQMVNEGHLVIWLDNKDKGCELCLQADR